MVGDNIIFFYGFLSVTWLFEGEKEELCYFFGRLSSLRLGRRHGIDMLWYSRALSQQKKKREKPKLSKLKIVEKKKEKCGKSSLSVCVRVVSSYTDFSTWPFFFSSFEINSV